MAISTLDLLNARIDLSDVLSWRASQTPRFIRLFSVPQSSGASSVGRSSARYATNAEHFWLEGVEAPKTKAFSAYAYADSPGTFTVDSSVGWQVGDLFHILGDSAVLRVSAVTSTTIVPELVAANGSALDLSTYTASSGGTLVSTAPDQKARRRARISSCSRIRNRTSRRSSERRRDDRDRAGDRPGGMENAINVQLNTRPTRSSGA